MGRILNGTGVGVMGEMLLSRSCFFFSKNVLYIRAFMDSCDTQFEIVFERIFSWPKKGVQREK